MSQPTRFLHCLLFPVLATLLGALSAPAAAQLYLRTAPIEMNTDPMEYLHEDQPRLACDGAGQCVAVWSEYKLISGWIDETIVVSRSADNGATWTNGTNVNPFRPTGVHHYEYHPEVVTDAAGTWIIIWVQRNGEMQQELYVSRSADNGATWSAPYMLGVYWSETSFYDGASIATDSAGHWVVVWPEGDSVNADIRVARSADNGISWSTAASLSPAADNWIDITPSIATDAAGRWISVWMSFRRLNGGCDIITATSTDNGQSWSSPAPIDGNGDVPGAFYEKPDIEFAGGHWVAAWGIADPGSPGTGDRDILVARSNDNGTTWTEPAVLDPLVSTEGNDIAYFGPRITTDGAGNWIMSFLRSDTSSAAGYLHSYFSRSSDNGASWGTAIQLLPTSGHEERGSGRAPAIATDRAGHWIALWETRRLVAPPTWYDYDLLYSRWTGILAPDRDGDDLSDVTEFSAGTSSDWWDTDSDGISDAEEVNTHLTNPVSSDSDGDGAPDISEIDLGTDPNDALDFPILPLSWKWLAAIGTVAAAALGGYRYRRTQSRAV